MLCGPLSQMQLQREDAYKHDRTVGVLVTSRVLVPAGREVEVEVEELSSLALLPLGVRSIPPLCLP